MASSEIQLADDDTLIDELKSRYDNVVIALERPHSKHKGERIFKWRWNGSVFNCLGLATLIIEGIHEYRRLNHLPHDKDS